MSARWRRTRTARNGQADPARAQQPDISPPTGPALPGSLEGLLDDMLELRLTLVADLSAAAAAVEADSGRVAGDIIDSDRRELANFLRRSTLRLNGAGSDNVGEPAAATTAPAVPTPRSRRRRALISLPAVPLVGALAMSAAAAAGLLPLPTQSHSHVRVVSEPPVASTFQRFATVLDGDPSASQVVAAASALHEQIAALLAEAPQNPNGVSEVAHLLQLEQALLMRKQPPGSSVVLAQSRRLAAQLLTVAHAVSPAAVPTSSTASPHRSTSTKPTSSTSSPTPKSSTSKPAPPTSPSPSPSPTSSDAPGHIPSIGG